MPKSVLPVSLKIPIDNPGIGLQVLELWDLHKDWDWKRTSEHFSLDGLTPDEVKEYLYSNAMKDIGAGLKKVLEARLPQSEQEPKQEEVAA